MNKKMQLENLVNIYKNLNDEVLFQYFKIGAGAGFTFGSINHDLSLRLLDIYDKTHNYIPSFFESLNYIIYNISNGVGIGLGTILIASGTYNLAKNLRK